MLNKIKKAVLVGLSLVVLCVPTMALDPLNYYGTVVPGDNCGVLFETKNVDSSKIVLHDVIVKKGVAFVSATELSKTYGIALSESDTGVNFSTVDTSSQECSLDFSISSKGFACIFNLEQSQVNKGYKIKTETIECYDLDTYWAYDPSTWKLITKTIWEIVLSPSEYPFKKDGTWYIPAKLTGQLINTGKNYTASTITDGYNVRAIYNPDNNTITIPNITGNKFSKCVGYISDPDENGIKHKVYL